VEDIVFVSFMPHKEIRKIIRIGKTSFAVILPISWLRFYDMRYGDSVEVISNGSVIVRPLEKKEQRGLNDSS